jgi:hypothetical protein
MKKTTEARAARAGQGAALVSRAGHDPDMADEYELDRSTATRNPFYAGLPAGSRRVLVPPDIAAVFADSALVNQALRLLVEVARAHHTHPAEPGAVYGGWLATIEPDVASACGSAIDDALRGLIRVARDTIPAAAAERTS